jgi:hypothetical protein
MKRHLPVRLLACAALAGSASLAAVAIPGGIASASPLSVTCTSLTGNASTQTISGCTGTGAIAADAGTPPAHGVSTTSTKTIKWSTNKTSVSTYTYTSGSDKSCPAVKGYKVSALENAKGTVKSGSATGMIGSTFKGTICVYAKGSTILVKNKGSFTV